jgi:hypothetical protein
MGARSRGLSFASPRERGSGWWAQPCIARLPTTINQHAQRGRSSVAVEDNLVACTHVRMGCRAGDGQRPWPLLPGCAVVTR